MEIIDEEVMEAMKRSAEAFLQESEIMQWVKHIDNERCEITYDEEG